MTNEAAIAKAALKMTNIRLNKDGKPNGNAVHGVYKSLKASLISNGMEHNEACRVALNSTRVLAVR